MRIGPYQLANNLVLAPMAGVTDRPFRTLCRRFGAGMTTSEMTTADISLWKTAKSQRRLDIDSDAEPRVVQIAGSEPGQLALAARLCEERGAQIIDINMGCPAKKVCNKLAGSALLSRPDLVRAILEAVVGAVRVPVTLKIRTGPNPRERNGVDIARIAEDAGLAALAGALQSGGHQKYVERPAVLDSDDEINDGNRILRHLFGSKDVSRNVAANAAEMPSQPPALTHTIGSAIASASRLSSMWAGYYRRWKHLRAKLFIRSDLYAEQFGMMSADVAKMAARKES